MTRGASLAPAPEDGLLPLCGGMAAPTPEMSSIPVIRARVAPARQRLVTHPLYLRMTSLDDVRRFMEAHVFAVWDFMSLLKRLQRDLTCVQLPWVPVGSPDVRHLVNEIVAGEESDVDAHGRRTSHFEIYVDAMNEAGADTAPILAAVDAVRRGVPAAEALAMRGIPAHARDFTAATLALAEAGGSHEVAAAFTFGREDLIPDLFHGLVSRLADQHPGRLGTFQYYLKRHIEVDGGEHGGLALRMVEALCGDDANRWSQASEASVAAIEARLRLWDGVTAALG